MWFCRNRLFQLFNLGYSISLMMSCILVSISETLAAILHDFTFLHRSILTCVERDIRGSLAQLSQSKISCEIKLLSILFSCLSLMLFFFFDWSFEMHATVQKCKMRHTNQNESRGQAQKIFWSVLPCNATEKIFVTVFPLKKFCIFNKWLLQPWLKWIVVLSHKWEMADVLLSQERKRGKKTYHLTHT